MRTLGISKVRITLQKPVRLCGFGFRTGVYDGAHRDVFVRVFDLRKELERMVFIYGSLLWWNSEFVDRMRWETMEALEIPKEQLLFVTSHNHSDPRTGDSFVLLLEMTDEEYLDYLASRILEAVRQAGEDQEEVTLVRSDGSCALNVFRRVMTKQDIATRPNHDVEPDRTLTVLSLYRVDKTSEGRLVHYPYHANLSKDNELYPDYPGYVLKRLDRESPGSVHMFLQGYMANMRPNCMLGDQLWADTKADMEVSADCFYEAMGEAAGNAVGNVVESVVRNATGNTEGSTINNGILVTPGMTLSIRQYRLSLIQNFTKEDMETYAKDSREETRQWAAKAQEKKLRDYETLEVVALSLGKEKLYFLNAGVSMHYVKFLRGQYPGAICAGYTNGMIGYLSPVVQTREGGHEPQESAVYSALAGTHKEEIQDIIETALVQWVAYITRGEKGETMEEGRLTDSYYEEILSITNEIHSMERGQVLKVAHMVVDQVKQDKKVLVFGPDGHSNPAAMEVFFRTDGLMHIDAVPSREIMLNNGALKSIQVERLPGYGRTVMEDYGIGEGDSLRIVNTYGVNPAIIDVVLIAKEKGAKIIGVSSREHAETCPKEHMVRHPSKLNLHDIVDCAVDCKVKLGDATLEIDGFPQKIGALSTYVSACAINCIVTEAINMLVNEGVNPPIWRGGNCLGGDEWGNQFIDRFKGRIRRL